MKMGGLLFSETSFSDDATPHEDMKLYRESMLYMTQAYNVITVESTLIFTRTSGTFVTESLLF